MSALRSATRTVESRVSETESCSERIMWRAMRITEPSADEAKS
ncbi:hypothetical protein NONI108955_35765 [Nocardia ninae]